MKLAAVTADIYASGPGAVYRVYIDDTLMTERTFIWQPNENYITEQMVINADENIAHTVRVISLDPAVTFTIKNVTVHQQKSETTFRL